MSQLQRESRQSHAVVFVPLHLGPVKGSSPDLIPLIYLFILTKGSNSTPSAFGNNKINKVISITSGKVVTKYGTSLCLTTSKLALISVLPLVSVTEVSFPVYN